MDKKLGSGLAVRTWLRTNAAGAIAGGGIVAVLVACSSSPAAPTADTTPDGGPRPTAPGTETPGKTSPDGSTPTSTPDGATPATVAGYTDFALKQALAQCKTYVLCGEIGAARLGQCEADAVANAKKFPAAYDLEEAIREKRLAFDPQAAAACLATGTTCRGQIPFGDHPCANVLKRLVANGGACKGDECAAGFCDNGGAFGCTGTCKPFVAIGGACQPENPCDYAAAYCDPTTKKCVANVPEGGACTRDARCATPGKLHCAGADLGTNPKAVGKCVQRVGAGGACFGTNDCAAALFCDDAKKCVPLLAAGATCTLIDACADGLMCHGLSYSGTQVNAGKCAPYLDDGAACDPDALGQNCPFTAQCGSLTKTCEPPAKAGGDCTSKNCDESLLCIQGKCVEQLPLGAACTPAADPGDDLCHDGRCDGATKKCAIACGG